MQVAEERPNIVANAAAAELTEESGAQAYVRHNACPFCRGSPKVRSADSHGPIVEPDTEGGVTIVRCRCDST